MFHIHQPLYFFPGLFIYTFISIFAHYGGVGVGVLGSWIGFSGLDFWADGVWSSLPCQPILIFVQSEAFEGSEALQAIIHSGLASLGLLDVWQANRSV